MDISEKEIVFIDEYLKKKGIKYWDLRIEMIDHIVSIIEHDSKSINFKSAFKNSLVEIGWLGNLAYLNALGWKNVNTWFRREYHKGFLNFFKCVKNVILFLSATMLLYILSENITFQQFEVVCFTLFVTPLTLVLIEFIKSSNKKYGRSVNLDYSTIYLVLSFLILNVFPTFFSHLPETIQKVGWFFLLMIHYVAFYSGYRLYKKTIIKLNSLNKLYK